jgi:hypothetical protein
VSVIAVIRPDGWNFPLLVHVLGAMTMVGALALSATSLVIAWRGGEAAMVRLGYRALLLGALPAWIVMRAGAAWIASKEHLSDANFTWLTIGFTTSEGGLVILLIATLLAGLGRRRLARAEGDAATGVARASALLVGLLLIAYVVTIWAMTAKPT